MRFQFLYEVCRLRPRQLVTVSEGQRERLYIVQPWAHALHHVVEAQALITRQQAHRPEHLSAHLPCVLHHLDSLDHLVGVKYVVVVLRRAKQSCYRWSVLALKRQGGQAGGAGGAYARNP